MILILVVVLVVHDLHVNGSPEVLVVVRVKHPSTYGMREVGMESTVYFSS